MKTYAIMATIGLVINMSTPASSEMTLNDTTQVQTLSIPEYSISFVRGSYELIEANYDNKTQLSDEQLENILIQAGFSGYRLKMAKAIAFYESTNRPMALNKYSNCYGLFQINMSGSMGPDRREKYDLKSNEDLFNPLINAQIAYKMSDGGTNWSAWTTYGKAKSSLN